MPLLEQNRTISIETELENFTHCTKVLTNRHKKTKILTFQSAFLDENVLVPAVFIPSYLRIEDKFDCFIPQTETTSW